MEHPKLFPDTTDEMSGQSDQPVRDAEIARIAAAGGRRDVDAAYRRVSEVQRDLGGMLPEVVDAATRIVDENAPREGDENPNWPSEAERAASKAGIVAGRAERGTTPTHPPRPRT